MQEKKQYKRIVFLDSKAAFAPRKEDWWWHRHGVEEVVKSLEARERDWNRERYSYHTMVEKVKGYWHELEFVANEWSAEAAKGFAKVLKKHDAGFVLSSESREMFGRGALASLFAVHDLEMHFVDMTVSPAPLFLDDINRKVVEGAADRSLLELYTRTMRFLWTELCEGRKGRRGIDHRTVEILEYLDRHPEIESFAVVDDRDLSVGIGKDRMVVCNNVMDKRSFAKLEAALRSKHPVRRLPPRCKTDELRRFREECVPALYRRWRDAAYSGQEHD